MVRVRVALPRDNAGVVDVDQWLALVAAEHPELSIEPLEALVVELQSLQQPELLEAGVDLAQLLLELGLEHDALLVGIAYRASAAGALDAARLEALLGSNAMSLLRDVERLGRASLLPLQDPPMLKSGAEEQVDNVRNLLESLIDDARVALIKLAERVVALRQAKNEAAARRERLARESLALFAPLAGRLGIWHLKWAIEDLAFRYLEPEVYQRIAGQLDGRRDERVRRINELETLLQEMLSRAGIRAEVMGRAKHIYSIYRKMQDKDLDVAEVYDVRALRVLVEDTGACYQALGVIHTAWRHLPQEFDDYIANAKDNGYQSIHTAVVGPRDEVLEVQIRTHEMHAEAEFGVCAHWNYKEPQRNMSNERVLWLRQLLEWYDAGDGSDNFESLLSAGFYDDRIYVTTPQGHVLDLPQGATPLDFAYRVHTEVGHRAESARVDGEPSALNTPLATGQRVRILTRDDAAPSRNWLDEHLGFVHTARARAKILQWYRHRDEPANTATGRELWRISAERLQISPELPAALLTELGFESPEACYLALALDEISIAMLVRQLPESAGEDDPAVRLVVRAENRSALLRDITEILTDWNIALVATEARLVEAATLVNIALECEPVPLAQLSKVLDRLASVAGVTTVYRDVRSDGLDQ